MLWVHLRRIAAIAMLVIVLLSLTIVLGVNHDLADIVNKNWLTFSVARV